MKEPEVKERASETEASQRRPGWPGLALKTATLLYLALLAMILLTNAIGPESWWFGSLNLYLPQWIWALPCALLLPWYALRARRFVWLPLLLLLWVLGPLMGFCWRWLSPAPSEKDIHLRVMTYNVKWGHHKPEAIFAEIAQTKPDVILMQDAGGTLNHALKPLQEGWNVQAVDQFILLSRYPLSEPEVRWISPRKNHRCIRCVAQVGSMPVTLYDVHLMSPRIGLGSIRHPRANGTEGLQNNVDTRLEQATLLAEHLKEERGPLLVMGDLNAPVHSLVCRTLFALGLRDAFSDAGRGYGYSYGQSTKIRFPYVRIDHIMVSPHWQVQDCWTGNSEGSEHSPVIADLFLPASH